MDKLYTLYITLNSCDDNTVNAIKLIRKLGSNVKFDMGLLEAKKIWEGREKSTDAAGKPEIKLLTGVTGLQLKEWFKKFGMEYRDFRLAETSEIDIATIKLKASNLVTQQQMTTGASSSPPPKPLIGSLWINTNTGKLLIYNGADWVEAK